MDFKGPENQWKNWLFLAGKNNLQATIKPPSAPNGHLALGLKKTDKVFVMQNLL